MSLPRPLPLSEVIDIEARVIEDPPPKTDTAADVISALFPALGPESTIELRCLRSKKPTSHWFTDYGKFLEAAKKASDAGWDAYWGCAARRGKRRGDGSCSYASAMRVDLDFKLFANGEAEARTKLAAYRYPPSIVIATGGGLHVYWLLNELYRFDDDAKRDAFRRATEQLAKDLSADPDAVNIERILRVPGTQNHKPERNGFIVTVEEFYPERRYRFDEFGLTERPEITVAESTIPHEVHSNEPAPAPMVERAKEWIAEQPPAIQGDRGDKRAFSTAAMITRDFGLNYEQTFEVMQGWNAKCSPPWEPKELMDKIQNSQKYGKNPVGADDSTKDFGLREPPNENPALPKSLQVGLLKEFIELYQNSTECPVEFLWSAFATALGGLFSPFVEFGNHNRTQPRLFTANVGPSAVSRKSTGADLASKTIGQVMGNGLFFVNGFGSAEGLLTALKKHGTVLNYIDELDILFSKTSTPGSVGTSLLHVLYNGNAYHHIVRDESKCLSVTNANLAIITNTTTERYPQLWDIGSLDTGFLSRWTVILGNPTKRIPDPPMPNEAQCSALVENIGQFWQSLRTPQVEREICNDFDQTGRRPIGYANEKVRKRWADFYCDEIDAKDSCWNRLDTQAERIMLILAIAKGQLEIDDFTLQGAIDFARYEVRIRRELQPVEGITPEAKLENHIRQLKARSPESKKSQIYKRAHGERYGKRVFDSAYQSALIPV